MGTKYGNLVKTLAFKENMGGAPAILKAYMDSSTLEGMNLNFVIGVYDITGLWAPRRGYRDTDNWTVDPRPMAHAHSFDEFLLFFGYDGSGLSKLGADLELSMGKEWEKHRITEPSMVVLPKDLPHCPLYTDSARKAYGHMHLALNPEFKAYNVEQAGDREGNKYARLVKKLPLSESLPGAAQGFSIAGDDMEGLNLNFTMGLYDKEGEWFPGMRAHTHQYDELLIFFGGSSDDPNGLGAEITAELGGEREKHIFTQATVIIVPKGTPHMPVVFGKVEKPFYAVQAGFSADMKTGSVA